jgi:hypothetical protein
MSSLGNVYLSKYNLTGNTFETQRSERIFVCVERNGRFLDKIPPGPWLFDVLATIWTPPPLPATTITSLERISRRAQSNYTK